MEWVGLLVLLILGVPICFVIWLILRLQRTAQRIEQLSIRQTRLEGEIAQLRAQLASTGAPAESVVREPAVPIQPALEIPKPTPQPEVPRPREIIKSGEPVAAPEIIRESAQEGSPLPPLIAPTPAPSSTSPKKPVVIGAFA